MERNITSLEMGVESPALSTTRARSRCSTCGEEFEKPLLAMISSGFLLEKYYACPKCLSKVGIIENQKNDEVEKAEEEEDENLEMEVENKMEENVACTHNFGYLKQRPRDTPIPEECLTCTKMIECMSH